VTAGDGATGEVLPQFAIAIVAAPMNTAITHARIDVDVIAMGSPFTK